MEFNMDFLIGIGIDAEKAEAILDMHADTVAYYDGLRKAAERARETEAEINHIKRIRDEENEWKKRYEDVRAEFSEFKSREEAKKQRSLKENVYERVLRNVGVPSKLVSLIMRSNPTGVDSIILDGNCLVNEQAIKSQIFDEYSDFIEKPARVRF